MRRGLAVVATVALCGCSFVFVHGPKPPPAPPSDCTSSQLVPILDGVATGVFAAFAIYSAVAGDADYRSNFCDQFDSACTAPDRGYTIATSLAVAAVTGVAAYIGRTRVNECQAASFAPVLTPAPPAPAPPAPLAPAPMNPAPVTPAPSPPAPPPPPVTPAPVKPAPVPAKPAPPPPKPGTGSGELPVPPSGLPVPGA
jgi:hypothetical protein